MYTSMTGMEKMKRWRSTRVSRRLSEEKVDEGGCHPSSAPHKQEASPSHSRLQRPLARKGIRGGIGVHHPRQHRPSRPPRKMWMIPVIGSSERVQHPPRSPPSAQATPSRLRRPSTTRRITRIGTNEGEDEWRGSSELCQPTPSRVKCLVVQQGELAPRTQEHPSQERVGTSMLTQCTLGFEVAHAIRISRITHDARHQPSHSCRGRKASLLPIHF